MKTTGLGIVLLLLLAVPVHAGQAARRARGPHIGYVYPAGGQAGTTVQLVVGGMNLGGVSEANVSGSGVEVVSARPFVPFRPMSPDVRDELRPILLALQAGKDPVQAYARAASRALERRQRKRGDDGDDEDGEEKEPVVIASKREESLIYLPMTLGEAIDKIEAMTPLEFGILLKAATTRPNSLQASPAIDQIAIVEVKIAPDAAAGMRRLRLSGRGGLSNTLRFEVSSLREEVEVYERGEQGLAAKPVELPLVFNGQILPGEVDRVRFEAKGGSICSFALLGRTLVPFLGDAVPGWFQPILSVHDPKTGEELAFADDREFDPDPTLVFTAPRDGEFELRIRDSIYRGREDFVYRVTAREGEPPARPIVSPPASGLSEVGEAEPNNERAQASSVKSGQLIAGSLAAPGDVDLYAFAGRKGEQVVLEVFARRVNSPVDSLVRLLDSEGKVLAWNDDGPWRNIGTQTHHADSFLLHTLPADGTYYAQVSDAQGQGGEAMRYFLRLAPAQPDFAVYMDPSTLNGVAGSHTPVTFHVFRREGFDGVVNIRLKEGPEGVWVAGGHIPVGLDRIRCTIAMPPKLAREAHPLRLEAEAKIGGESVTHEVIASDEIMQAFLWTHFVAAEQALLYPSRRGFGLLSPPDKQLVLQPGTTVSVVFESSYPLSKMARNRTPSFALDAPPKGLSLIETKIGEKRIELVVEAAADMEPWEGNLVFDVLVTHTGKRPNGGTRSFVNHAGCLPAVPVKLVP